MSTKNVVSQIVAARSHFFALLEQLEEGLGREVDVVALQALIDSEYDGQAEVTEQEATRVIATACPLRLVA